MKPGEHFHIVNPVRSKSTFTIWTKTLYGETYHHVVGLNLVSSQFGTHLSKNLETITFTMPHQMQSKYRMYKKKVIVIQSALRTQYLMYESFTVEIARCLGFECHHFGEILRKIEQIGTRSKNCRSKSHISTAGN